MDNRRNAFTLLELLTVIGVLTLLAAIVIPTYSKARDRMDTIRCVSNLRTIGAGTLAWAADRNGMLWSRAELGYSHYRMVDDPMGAPQLLKDYLPDKRVWLCPAGRSSLKIFGNNYTWVASERHDKFPIYGRMDGAGNQQELAKVQLYFDAFHYSLPSMYNASDDVRGDGKMGPQYLNSKFYRRPHDNLTKVNRVYLDGHVKTVP